MADGDHLRASDGEREQLADELREHFAAGRINQEELDRRLGRVLGATTRGELEQLRRDLPRAAGVVERQRAAELERQRAKLKAQLLQQGGGSFTAFAICAVAWAASGAHGEFWPAWVAIAPASFLARNLWRLYGPAPEPERVEAELAKRRRGGRRARRRSRWYGGW